MYASKSGNNKLYLLNCLMNLRYKENSSISDHLNEFQGLLNQLSGMGIKFDDEVMGLWLLNTLLESWEVFWVSITNSASNGVVSFQMAKSGALNEEMRRKALVLHLSLRCLLQKLRGEVRKRNIKVVERRVGASPSQDTTI